MSILDEKITTIEKVHQEFFKIMKMERCRTCSCLHTDMLSSILDNIREINPQTVNNELLADAEKDFSKWLEDATHIDLHL